VIWLRSNASGVFVHELGHNLGLVHSSNLVIFSGLDYSGRTFGYAEFAPYSHPACWMSKIYANDAQDFANRFSIGAFLFERAVALFSSRLSI
jgi:hypothetical protein